MTSIIFSLLTLDCVLSFVSMLQNQEIITKKHYDSVSFPLCLSLFIIIHDLYSPKTRFRSMNVMVFNELFLGFVMIFFIKEQTFKI